MATPIWEPKGDGWYALASMAQDSDAILRGGEVWVKPSTLEAKTAPWADGSGDAVIMTPEITGPLDTPVPTVYGWTVTDLGTGTLWEIVSLQETKWTPYLGGFAAPGWKLMRHVDAISANYVGNEWRPKKLYVTSNCPINYEVQSAFADESPQEPWVLGSVAFKHADKRDNSPAGNYTTGKIHHMPAPLVTGWKPDGSYVGKAVGRWEKFDGGIDKVFDKWDVEGLIALGASKLCTDATTGYTSVGASNYAFKVPWGRVVGPISGTGKVVSSISWYCGNAADTGFEMIFAGYTVTGLKATPTSLITGCEGHGPIPGTTQWMTVAVGPTSVSNGQYIGICDPRYTGSILKGFNGRYDNYGTGSDYLWDPGPAPSPVASAPATWPQLSKDPNPADFSAYLTYGDPPPSKATNPDPSNTGTITASSYTLSWTDGGGATSYDVWVGGSKVSVGQAGTTYAATGLTGTVTWRIDSINASGTTTGDEWTFTVNAVTGWAVGAAIGSAIGKNIGH